MKNLHLYLSLLFILTCAKEDSQAPNTAFQVIENTYTLTVTAGEGGSVSTGGGEYKEGTEVTITAIPNEGYGFIGWNGFKFSKVD